MNQESSEVYRAVNLLCVILWGWVDIYHYTFVQTHRIYRGFPGGSDSEESACNAGDPGSIPGLGRSPGAGSGNPLQSSCLENAMDRGACRPQSLGP